MEEPLSSVTGIAAAALGGLAVGIEREWSGHAGSRFAGVRTFTLLGGVAGIAGWMWAQGDHAPAVLLMAVAASLVIAAYVAASRHDLEATTEVAALVVLGAAFLAGRGELVLASAVVATTVLVLIEKSRLHAWVRELNDTEIRAAARFAVMAVVILPLLPEGPYGPFGGVRPRQLWALVLLFSGISFLGYIARRFAGPERGYTIAGLLGGLISSTQVTLAYARASRTEQRVDLSLASGALAASTVLFVRTLFAAAVLDPRLAVALLPYAIAPFLCGVAATLLTMRRSAVPQAEQQTAPANPLQLRGALQLALLFQIVLTGVHIVHSYLGDPGLLASGAVVGLTDVDAVTVSMARMLNEGVAPMRGAQAVAVGVLSNTLLKAALAAAIGRGRFRAAVSAGLCAMSVTIAAAVLFWH
ncbi:MAG: MgtC/SapB family protein [Candidatus Binatia bacterium]